MLMVSDSGDSYTSYPGQEREEDPPYKCKILTEGERFRQKPNWVSVQALSDNDTELIILQYLSYGSLQLNKGHSNRLC